MADEALRCLSILLLAAIVAPFVGSDILRIHRTGHLVVENYLESNASEHLRVALIAAKEAAEISRHYYAGNFTVTTKADLTPVTQADVEC